jgi:hypothetical protein
VPFPGANAAFPAGARVDQQSWSDAIAFMLTNYGHSADFIVAMQNVFRRSAKFFGPELTELPTLPRERYTDGIAFETYLRRRLYAMRIIRPNFDSNHDAAARADPGWSTAVRVWNAIAPRGNDIAGPNAVAHLAAINAVFPAGAQWVAADCTDFIGQNRAGANRYGTLQASAYWHQFFANVHLVVDADESELQRVLRSMTTTETNSLRSWLAMDFFDAIGNIQPAVALAAAIPLPGNANTYMLPITTFTGVAIPAGAGDTTNNLIGAGRYYRRDHNLPVHNMHEIFTYTVPVGCSALRQVRMNAKYNDDVAAIHLANRLRNLGGQGFLHRFATIATQWRAATDSVACALALTGGVLNHKKGSPSTGNARFDAQYSRTIDRGNLGGIGQYLEDYISAISIAWSTIGYLSTVHLEYENNVTQFNFAQESAFSALRDMDAGAPRLNTMSNHLVWRCFHPILVGIFCPTLPLRGGMISKIVPKFGALSSGIELPWDTWHLKLSDKIEIAGYFRILTLLAGYTIRYRPTYVYAPSRAGVQSTLHRFWEQLDDIPPRLSDSAPWSPTLAQDPYWYYDVPHGLQFVLDVPAPVNERYPFMLNVRLVAYQSMPVLSCFPALLPNDKLSPASSTAAPGHNGLSIVGTYPNFVPNASPSSRRTYAPGMFADRMTRYETDDQDITEAFMRSANWFSRLMSANTVYQRSWAGFTGNRGRALTDSVNGPNVMVGPNGNPALPVHFTGANAGVLLTVQSCHATGCYWAPPLAGMPNAPALGFLDDWTDNPHLRLFYNIMSYSQARLSQWYFQPYIATPPVLLGDASSRLVPELTLDYDPTANMDGPGAALMHNRFMASLRNTPSARRGDVVIGTEPNTFLATVPLAAQQAYDNTIRREEVSFAQPVVVPIETAPTHLHFNSGLGAVIPEQNDPRSGAPPLSEVELKNKAIRQEIETLTLLQQLADLKKGSITPMDTVTPPLPVDPPPPPVGSTVAPPATGLYRFPASRRRRGFQ